MYNEVILVMALMIGTTFSCIQHWCFQGRSLSLQKESMYVKATNTTSISRLSQLM